MPANPRVSPFEARLTPDFVRNLSAKLGELQASERGMLGLLFGKADQALLNLHVFANVARLGPEEEILDRERLERTLSAMLSESESIQPRRPLDLVGWCWFQRAGDGDALKDCLELHNRHFRRASDVFIVLRPGPEEEISGRVYARASQQLLSPEDLASGYIAIDAGEPRAVQVAIWRPTTPQLCLNTFQALNAMEERKEREQRRQFFGRIANKMRRVARFGLVAAVVAVLVIMALIAAGWVSRAKTKGKPLIQPPLAPAPLSKPRSETKTVPDPPLTAHPPAEAAPASVSHKPTAGSPPAPQNHAASGALLAGKSSRDAQAKATTMVMPDVTSISASDLPQTGRIEVEVEVDDTGRVAAAHLANRSDGNLTGSEKAAIAAAENWRFEPATVNGKNVSSKLTIAFDFR